MRGRTGVYKLCPGGVLSVYIENDRKELGPETWYVTGVVICEESGYLYTSSYQTGQVRKYPMLPDGTAGEPILVATAPYPTQMAMDEHGGFGRGALDSQSLFVTNLNGTVSRIKVETKGR